MTVSQINRKKVEGSNCDWSTTCMGYNAKGEIFGPTLEFFSYRSPTEAQRVWGRDRAAPCNHNFWHNENCNENK